MRAIKQDRLRVKREKLEAALKTLTEQEREQDERRHATVGRAVLRHAEHDEAFRQQLTALLDRTISSKRERILLGLSGSTARQRREASDAAA